MLVRRGIDMALEVWAVKESGNLFCALPLYSSIKYKSNEQDVVTLAYVDFVVEDYCLHGYQIDTGNPNDRAQDQILRPEAMERLAFKVGVL